MTKTKKTIKTTTKIRYIILDTNFLLIPAQFKVDVFAEIGRVCDFSYKLCVLEGIIDVLKGIIKNQAGKHKKAAKLALSLIKTKDLKIIPIQHDDTVDNLIVELTAKAPSKWVVATQDAGLKKRLKKQKIKLIILRQKKYLRLK